MPIRVTDSYNSRNESLPSPNRGMSVVAQQQLGQMVERSNYQYQQAINTDGYPVRIWSRTNGAVPCTCCNLVAVNDSVVLGSNANLVNDPQSLGTAPRQTSPFVPTIDVADDGGPHVFKLRDSNRTQALGGVIDNFVESDDTVDTTLPDLDAITNEYPQKFTGDNLDRLALQALNDASGFLSGGDRTACGICFGKGYVDSMQLFGGQRVLFDASNLRTPVLVGAEILHSSYPNAFRVARTNNWVQWTIEVPTYFQTVSALRVWNNLEACNPLDYTIEYYTGSTWATLTLTLLNSWNGTSTKFAVRVRPLRTSPTLGPFVFTHLEMVYEYVPLVKAQFPQITQIFNVDQFDNPTSIQIEVDPTVSILGRESIIENTFTRMLWKVTEVVPRQTAMGQTFGYVIQARNIQLDEPEQRLAITISTDLHLVPYRGLETAQGISIDDDFDVRPQTYEAGYTGNSDPQES